MTKPIQSVTKVFYGYSHAGSVCSGPFGTFDFMGRKDGFGRVGIQPPPSLGMFGHGAKIAVTFRVIKRGKLKQNPWVQPEPFPDYCDSKGNIKG
jgi:hypothetical protein